MIEIDQSFFLGYPHLIGSQLGSGFRMMHLGGHEDGYVLNCFRKQDERRLRVRSGSVITRLC